MAKKSTAIVVRSAPRHHRAPQPIIVRSPRAAPVRHHKKHRGGARRVSAEKALMGIAIGGLVLGFVDKQGTALNIPTIPVLGKAGTLALVAHFIGKGRPGVLTDVRNAAVAIAAYEFGSTGKVSGEDVSGAPMVSGRL